MTTSKLGRQYPISAMNKSWHCLAPTCIDQATVIKLINEDRAAVTLDLIRGDFEVHCQKILA